MSKNIGSMITKPLSYYLDIFRGIDGIKINNFYQFTHKEYISIDGYSKKMKYVNEGDYEIELSFDVSLDKLTFTEYTSNKTSFVRKYNRRVYSNISQYLNDDYYFQQSTVHEVLFSTEELAELYELYYKFST